MNETTKKGILYFLLKRSVSYPLCDYYFLYVARSASVYSVVQYVFAQREESEK